MNAYNEQIKYETNFRKSSFKYCQVFYGMDPALIIPLLIVELEGLIEISYFYKTLLCD